MPSIAIEQPYEAVYIVDADLGDGQIGTITAKYRAVVENGGGIVEKIEQWERRRLAYEIKGRTEGIYLVMQFRSKPDVEAELRRIFQISEDQIRSLIVRRDEGTDAAPVLNGATARPQAPAPAFQPAAPAAQPAAPAIVESVAAPEPPVAETPSAAEPTVAPTVTDASEPAEDAA